MSRLFFTGFFFLSAFLLIASQTPPVIGATSECAAGFTCSTSGCAGISGGTCDGGFGICCDIGGTGGAGAGTGTGGGGAGGGKIVCYGQIKAGVCFPTGTGLSSRPVGFILASLMNWLLAIVGMIAIIAFVISGIQYLISAGDEGMIETAKRNMTYSIVGVLVALSGWVIIRSIDYALNGGLLGAVLGLFGF